MDTLTFSKLLRDEVLSVDQLSDDLINAVAGALADWDRTGQKMEAEVLSPGSFVYRSRKAPSHQCLSKSDLGAPPASLAIGGRANPAGRTVFYAANCYEPTFFELGTIMPGDTIICGVWRVEKPIIVLQLGFNNDVYRMLEFEYKFERSSQNDHANTIAAALGILFCASEDYDFTSKIFDLHSGNSISNIEKLEARTGHGFGRPTVVAGVSYPTLRFGGKSRNYALLPEVANSHLSLHTAREYRVSDIRDKELDVTIPNTAEVFDGTDVCWVEGSHNFVIGDGTTAKIVATKGCNEFGWYIRMKDGSKGHWAASDQGGNPIRPVVSVTNASQE